MVVPRLGGRPSLAAAERGAMCEPGPSDAGEAQSRSRKGRRICNRDGPKGLRRFTASRQADTVPAASPWQ